MLQTSGNVNVRLTECLWVLLSALVDLLHRVERAGSENMTGVKCFNDNMTGVSRC